MLPTIHAAAQDIRAGRLNPIDLLKNCLDHIDRYEPKVRAWVFVDRDGARASAEERTAELKHGQWRGPLHGIPVGIKDIIDVFDWPTAAGSKLWANSVARRDATVVARLRQAGAILLGKTVTTQYASFDPPVTRNPWDLAHTPGGSSSGSAAAVACGMCPAALGTQTGGSIVRPASYCGVPSCKPTWGRVSTDGVVPFAPSLDHIGPMAGCVRDLALLLQTIGGPDERDPACSPRPMPDLLAALDQKTPPPCLGRLRGMFDDQADPPVRQMMEKVERQMREAGARFVDIALPAAMAEVLPRHRIVMAVEALLLHEPRLKRHPEDYQPKIKSLLEEGLACSAAELARCKEHQELLRRQMLPLFEGVDALLTPATPGPAPLADTTGNPAFQSPWSYTGLPTVAIPTGHWSAGLPLCIQLVGRPWSEPELLAAGAWGEAVLGVERREPAEG